MTSKRSISLSIKRFVVPGAVEDENPNGKTLNWVYRIIGKCLSTVLYTEENNQFKKLVGGMGREGVGVGEERGAVPQLPPPPGTCQNTYLYVFTPS